MSSPLVDARALFAERANPDLRLFDCRFSLADPGAGALEYAAGHLPGAQYAHLNRDLSGPIVPGKTGRHPLPDLDQFAGFLGRSGVSNRSRVVAYDDAGGTIAARLWWLMRYVGHDDVSVLDGGFSAWANAGFAIEQRAPEPARAHFTVHARPELAVGADEVERFRASSAHRVIDARAGERYRGEVEPIDRVAGHIPGARSLPFALNLSEGRFRSPDELRAQLRAALGDVSPENAAVYCGSGVTACHHLLAAAHAGIAGMRLYPGSWSEWIASGTRPVAAGAGSDPTAG